MHINFKLIDNFKAEVNLYEIEKYFDKIISKLFNSALSDAWTRKIIIVGDVSFNFEIFQIFFKEYKKIIKTSTFFVLGNHELWDSKIIKECKNYDEAVMKYATFLNSLEIYLLENVLYVPKYKKNFYNFEEIMSLTEEDVKNMFLASNYAIFGAMGFAGLNDNFNCNNGLYSKFPITREEEIKRSEITAKLHKKLSEIIPKDKKIIIATHMPKDDWTKDNYNPNWYYISGHTHKNYFCYNNFKKVYSDNQIGYHNDNFKFKYFTLNNSYDVFRYYEDGVHQITREQYLSYYDSIHECVTFTRPFYKLYLVKKKGTCCFVVELLEKSYCLLNGGAIKKYSNHDPQYFYKYIDKYVECIKTFLKDYNKYEESIAEEVKQIGGEGYIHGCIINIDFLNHLYINPIDGTITPYYATSMVDKTVYKNLISLLKDKREDLYNNFKKIGDPNKHELVYINEDLVESNEKIYVSDTLIYKASRIIKGLQYTTKCNLVRIWNEDLIESPSFNSGRIIVKKMIEN